MTGYLKRVMGLVLVLSVSAWAHAVCPMMLFPQNVEDCGQHAAHPVAASSQTAEHDCCPRKRVRMQHQQCDSTKLSSCLTIMSCCSVERQPASTPKVLQPATEIAVLGRVMNSALQSPSRAATLELSDAGPPLRGIMTLKEDLRI
jgi:hypothetical protein